MDNENNVKNGEVNKGKETFNKFLGKTTEFSKKAAIGVQKGAKELAEQTKKSLYEQRMKKYNPLFPKQYKSKDFHLPNVIKIVDDAERKGIDVCEGAIGWLGKENNIEIFYLYDEWIKQSGLEFTPAASCNEIYVVDRFNRNRFIRTDCVFEIAHAEKLAELEHIAYSLGAKCCAIEIAESSVEVDEMFFSQKSKANVKVVSASESTERSVAKGSVNSRNGKTTTYFEGNATPSVPQLKWFAKDDNINRLIEMRFSESNSIKSRTLILEGASSATMAQTAACEMDTMIKKMGYKTSVLFESKAKKEYTTKLIFEIEF